MLNQKQVEGLLTKALQLTKKTAVIERDRSDALLLGRSTYAIDIRAEEVRAAEYALEQRLLQRFNDCRLLTSPVTAAQWNEVVADVSILLLNAWSYETLSQEI